MFTEELNLINQAETDAEALRKNAKAEARRLIEEANTKAEKRIAKAQAEAKAEYDALIKEGQRIAEENDAQAIAAAKAQCDEMTAKAQTREADVVKNIVERIVISSVDH